MSRPVRVALVAAGILVAVAAAPPVSSEPRPVPADASALVVEAEVRRGDPLCRVIVRIRNHADVDLEFASGARGGPGSLDDGFRLPDEPPVVASGTDDGLGVVGTAPTRVPVLVFERGDALGTVTFRPPAFGGPTRRAMRVEWVNVPAGESIDYASFAVPATLLTGPFVRGTIDFGPVRR